MEILSDFRTLVSPLVALFRREGADYAKDLQYVDLFAAKNGRILAVEVKSGSSTLRDAQKRRLELIKRLGIRHVVARVHLPCEILVEFDFDV